MIKFRYSNVFGMYIIKLISVISPLILIPFLSRALGPDEFSIYLYILVLTVIPSTLIEYGFNVSATRLVAQADSIIDLSAIVSDITSAKLILIFPTIIVFTIATALIDSPANSIAFFSFALVIGILQGFNASWYFQGCGKILISASVEAVTNIILCVYLIFYLKNSATIYSVLVSTAVFKFIYIIIINYMMFASTIGGKISLIRGLNILFDVRPLMMRAGTFSFSFMASFVAGAMLNPINLGYYLIADKVCKSMNSLIQPLSQILFPIMSKQSKYRVAQHQNAIIRLLFSSVCVSMLISFVFFGTAGFLLNIFANTTDSDAITVFRILVWQLPLIVIYEVIGVQFLLASGQFTKFTISNAVGTCLFGFAWLCEIFDGDLINYSIAALSCMLATVLLMVYYWRSSVRK